MSGAPILANMGLQRSHQPDDYIQQGTSGKAETVPGETVIERPPPVVVNSLARTVIMQNGIQASQLLENEYQGSTSTNSRIAGDVEKWRFTIESTDWMSLSQSYLKMQLQFRSADPTNQGKQFGSYQWRLFPTDCSTGTQFSYHGQRTTNPAGDGVTNAVAGSANASKILPVGAGAVCGYISPFATLCLIRQFSVKIANNSFTEDCDPKMGKFGMHMMMILNNKFSRIDQLSDYFAGKYDYSLFPRKDEYQYLTDVGGNWADQTSTSAANGGLLAFGKAAGVANDKSHFPLIKGFRLLAPRCLYGERNAELLSDYNQVFFPTVSDTVFNEDIDYAADKAPPGLKAHGNDTWVYMRPLFTIFKSHQLIPPGTSLQLTIDTSQRDPTETSLMYRFPQLAAASDGYQNALPGSLSVYCAIKRMIMMTRVYRLAPDSHAALMSHFNSTGFSYAMPLMTVRRQIVNTNGANSATIEVWNGRLPDRFIIKFVDTRILDGNSNDNVQPWCCSHFPRNAAGSVVLSEADVRFNDVSLFANPIEFDYENTCAGAILDTSTKATRLRTDQVLRQGRRADFGMGVKRLEMLLQQFIGARENEELPLSRNDLAYGQFGFFINMDPSGGPYTASKGLWGNIKLRLVFKSIANDTGIGATDNLSILFIGFTNRHIFQSFSGVTSSNFSGGLAQQ